MFCQKCGGATKVCDTRYNSENNEALRRRICKVCNSEFFTIEFEIESDNKLDKLWKSLARSFGKKSNE